jgi:hypothetical protein
MSSSNAADNGKAKASKGNCQSFVDLHSNSGG